MRFEPGLSTQEYLQQIYHTLQRHGELYYGHGTDNAWDEACWLLDSIMAGSGNSLADPPEFLTDSQLVAIAQVLHLRIAQKKPLAYLLQEAWFADLQFYVDERVLVPRSPIAELIRNRFEPLLASPPGRILDLCAGSGCIGIACAHAFPDARVDLADVSAAGLEVAAINVDRFALASRVSVIQSDMYAMLEGPYDLIVCNPPYVSRDEYEALPGEYRQEPALGLVARDNGLALALQAIRQAGRYLTEDGMLILEVGDAWQGLEAALPDLAFLWLEFEHGGHGVCALRAGQLRSRLCREQPQ